MRKSDVKLFFYFSSAFLAFFVLAAGVSYGQASQKSKTSNPAAQASTKSSETNAKVDLNTASEKDLESLPGVGSATAKKITAGRPYSSVDDLSKAGVPAGTIKKIAPLVTVSGASASASKKAATTAAPTPPATGIPTKPASTNAKVDLNTASEKDLESLPGVGSATAKKITAGRPYSSVDDLSKAGVPASTIKKIAPLVLVSGGSAAAASTKASTPDSQPSPAAKSQPTTNPPAKTVSNPASQGSPGAGMVWVNLDSKVYHLEGDRYYGKTKNGKYMTLEDAKKAGYREAKVGGKPKNQN